jgi:hypothetical protein
MKSSFLVRLVFLLGFALMPTAARAQCVVTLAASNLNLSWNLNFNYQAVTVAVTKTSAAACNYGITFTTGGASSYTRRMLGGSGVALNYQLYGDSNFSFVLKDAPDITSNTDVILGSFPAGANLTQTVTYYVQVPFALATAPIIKPYGAYSDTFTIKAYEGTNPVQFVTPITTRDVSLSVSIPKIVQLSLGASGDAFDPMHTANSVALGKLTTGVFAQRSLMVRTNAGYSVTFSSLNNGVMKHSNPGITTAVPYTITLNGGATNLVGSQTNPVSVLSGSGQTSLQGNDIPISITIGNIQKVIAGYYSDTISINVSSTE